MTRPVPSTEMPSQPQQYSLLDNAVPATVSREGCRMPPPPAFIYGESKGGNRREKEHERQELPNFSMDLQSARRQHEIAEHQLHDLRFAEGRVIGWSGSFGSIRTTRSDWIESGQVR